MILARILSIILCLSSLSHAVEEENTWSPVKKGKLVGSFKVTGRVVPLEGALTIQSARLTGRVVNILKHEGEKITKGMPLLRINSAECITLHEEARVARERNLGDLVRSVQKRAQELDLRQENGNCDMIASASGTITKRLVEIGTTFNIGDALYHIINTKHLTVELDVPEKEIQRIAVGRKVMVSLPSDTGPAYSSKIINIVPALDSVTRTSRIRLSSFDFRHVPSLDSFVTGDIETDSPELTLLVPTSSLVFHQDKQWVVKWAKPTPIPLQVEVIEESSEESSIRPVIKGTLQADDKVVSKGAVFLFRQLQKGNKG